VDKPFVPPVARFRLTEAQLEEHTSRYRDPGYDEAESDDSAKCDNGFPEAALHEAGFVKQKTTSGGLLF
jgi:hypothetical protein